MFKELRGLKRKNILNIISISEDELWNSVLPQVFQDKNKIQLLKKVQQLVPMQQLYVEMRLENMRLLVQAVLLQQMYKHM